MKSLTDKQLSEILLKGGYIRSEDMSKAFESIAQNGGTLLDQLYYLDLLSDDILGQALSEYFKIPYWDLNNKLPSSEIATSLPNEIIEKYKVIPVKKSANVLTIAVSDPELITQLTSEVGVIDSSFKLEFVLSLSEDIESAIRAVGQPLQKHLSDIISKYIDKIPYLLFEIIKEAVSLKSSDIHFEPDDEQVTVRFRIDGVLQIVGVIPKSNYKNIINRLKVLGNLRIDEHYAAQDGAIRLDLEDGMLDLRISIIPTTEGEKIVLRVLANYARGLNLTDLGLNDSYRNIIKEAYKKPFGMILTTGPTGSGKTTTLYAVLKELNTKAVNITTIEDPVEYRVKGVNQVQVNTETGLTFATGLRSIVRQDPDVILVGEIRDKDTTEIALNAALTGHLVLSTFHANDAATAIPRLLDMGAEPFLLASTLNVIISQRLIRKLCDTCRYSTSVTLKDLEGVIPNASDWFGKTPKTIYRSKGCPKCGGTGYKGRTAIFEIIYITEEMQDLIFRNPSSSAIRELAKKQGAKSFFEDGMEKVFQGITSIEELFRVNPPEKNSKNVYGASKKS